MALSAQTRPEPMNASPHHSKVKVSLTLPHSIHVAGKHVSGKMEMECRADKGLGINIMMVELFASQELTSRDHSATSTFLHSRRLFQGPGLPPSNAVQSHPQPGDPPLPQNYYQARRGVSTFLFRIPLPSSAPSSISFGSDLARVRYEVQATVGVVWKGEKRLVTCKQEIDVVESYELDYSRVEPEGVVVGEFGKIWVQGRVVGGIIVAGEGACVELQVKNHSNKRNSGLTLTLSRTLVLPGLTSGEPSPLQISDVLTTVPFRGPEYVIQQGAEGIASLVFDVPKQARGVRGGTLEGDESEGRSSESLFEVRCIVGITLNMGIGTKDIQLNVPVTVVHPAALPEPTEYTSPAHNDPYPPSTPYPYSPPPISSPIPAAFIDPIHKQVWLPPPESYTPQPHYISPPLESIEHYYFPPPPHVPIVAYMPTRPLSAGPAPGDAFSFNHSNVDMGPALPPTSQHLPVPMSDLNVDPVEGKGERAARVTQHLRQSSRHRSVSPRSHRFPLTAPPVGGALYSFPEPPTSSEPTTDMVYLRNLPPAPLALSSPSQNAGLSPDPIVHSPRPYLSPKHSFSNSLPKSERVEELERMAQEVVNTTVDLSADLPKSNDHPGQAVPLAAQHFDAPAESNINKTLPIPPPPTKKAKEGAETTPGGRIRIDKFFNDTLHSEKSPSPHAAKSQAPPTPLAAVTPVKLPFKPKSHEFHAQLHPSGKAESGLDALERRLLAEVGTRKMDSGNEHPPVWDVVGAQPIDIPGKGKGVPDPLNDSAISSLTLAGERDATGEGDVEVDGGFLEVDGEHDSDEKTHRAAKSSISGDERGERGERGKKKAKRREKREKRGENGKEHTSRTKKSAAAKGRVAAWLGGIDPEVPPVEEVLPTSRVGLRKVPSFPDPTDGLPGARPEEEVIASDARGAVKDNLKPKTGEQDNSAVPNPRSSGFVPINTFKPGATQRHPVLSERDPSVVREARRVADIWSSTPAAKVPGKTSTPPKTTSPTIFPLISPARIKQSIRTDRNVSPPSTGALDVLGVDVEKHNINAPEAFANLNGIRPSPNQASAEQSLRVPVLTPHLDSELKYDIRSARGGRGGKVAAITSIWASGGPGTNVPLTKNNAKATVKTSQPLNKQTSADPVAHAPVKSLLTASAPPIAPVTIESKSAERAPVRRTPLVKSSSVPAVISSSHATPTLSSTASLARPLVNKAGLIPIKTSLAITEASPDPKSRVLNSTNATRRPTSANHGGELAFGQARLRDLIKKYQGQAT